MGIPQLPAADSVQEPSEAATGPVEGGWAPKGPTRSQPEKQYSSLHGIASQLGQIRLRGLHGGAKDRPGGAKKVSQFELLILGPANRGGQGQAQITSGRRGGGVTTRPLDERLP